MDFLKAEIASKKRTLSPAEGSSSQPAPKYMRKGDLERIRRDEEAIAEEARRQEQEQKKREKESKLFARAKKAAAAEQAAVEEAEASAANGSQGEDGKPQAVPSKPEAFNVSNTEAVRRLRAKGQPIRLFGETDSERRLRLRAVELIEERSEGQQNAFMRAMESMDKGLDLADLQKQAHGGHPALDRLKGGDRESSTGTGSESEDAESSDAKASGDTYGEVDLDLVKKNPSKVYPQIYYGIKRVLKEWEQSMADRPDHVKRSQQGKLAAVTQMQSAENLKPLMKQLRKRELQPDVLKALAEIVHYMQHREYLKASDSYLRLSIGTAPWPIGVTMVGIHARSAREKINSNSVAHVLNDEVSRKYIQSLKRLLTFAQTIRPPDDLSQRMG